MHAENTSQAHPIQVFWGEMSACEHFVQIYDDNEVFMNTLEDFIARGLEAGESCVIIATAAHLGLLGQRLRGRGVDIESLAADDRYIALVGEKVLAQFIIQGFPDDRLFNRVILDILARAKGPEQRKVRAFGEMVALLWAQGLHAAATQMEHLWHDLCRSEQFPLFCAYPRAGFKQDASKSIEQICATHSKVIGS